MLGFSMEAQKGRIDILMSKLQRENYLCYNKLENQNDLAHIIL
jgi:hypothetical protein